MLFCLHRLRCFHPPPPQQYINTDKQNRIGIPISIAVISHAERHSTYLNLVKIRNSPPNMSELNVLYESDDESLLDYSSDDNDYSSYASDSSEASSVR